MTSKSIYPPQPVNSSIRLNTQSYRNSQSLICASNFFPLHFFRGGVVCAVACVESQVTLWKKSLSLLTMWVLWSNSVCPACNKHLCLLSISLALGKSCRLCKSASWLFLGSTISRALGKKHGNLCFHFTPLALVHQSLKFTIVNKCEPNKTANWPTGCIKSIVKTISC